MVVDAVHARGGKVFVQLMHTGRVTQAANLPAGAEVLAPTANACPGEMYTDSQCMRVHSTPHRQAAAYVAKILGGAKPGDLPVGTRRNSSW